jgi:hypothetical protein
MAYIFMDESGDLGFDLSKKGASTYFLITFVVTQDKRALERMVGKAFRSLTKKQIRHHVGVLHAYKEDAKTRRRLLKGLAGIDMTVLCIYLNKEQVFTDFQNEKSVLYTVITNILLSRILTKGLVPADEPIHMVASRRETSRFLNENFTGYLRSRTKADHSLELNVEIKVPADEKSLQVADMVSWAIFRKYEYGDETYYDLIKQKIAEEYPLFG